MSPQASAKDPEYATLLKEIAILEKQTTPEAAQKLKDAQRRVAELLARKRKSDRFQVALQVAVRSGGQSGTGTVTNIGGGGLYLKTTHPLTKGTPVEVEVKASTPHLPAGVVFPGSVVWTRSGDGAGLSFAALDARTAEQLKRLLAALVKEQPPPIRAA